jgi:hypothetical protein
MTNTGKDNTGYRNTGDRNTGNWNTGDRNTGDWNTGDWNTGYRNTGDWNTGYWNTGNSNTGNWNTGYWNTGDSNTGNWNTTDRETGFFNTTQSDKVRVFNKDCDREVWENANKPDLLWFPVNEWISESSMTDQEKIDNETFHTTGGYLRSYEYQEAYQKSWHEASEEDRKLVEQLPNFDADVFLEISGIDVRKETEVKELTVAEIEELLGHKVKVVK